jgi:hypothetical protein
VTKREAQGDIPHFVVPSGSEASLASLGTASPLTSLGTASRNVIPRSASAEGPLAYARGDKKKRLEVTKKERLRMTTKKRGSG